MFPMLLLTRVMPSSAVYCPPAGDAWEKPAPEEMWWLNTERKEFESAPETSFFALGAASPAP
jgi:hypothetical protein